MPTNRSYPAVGVLSTTKRVPLLTSSPFSALFFPAGDHVKFGFPMASTVTVLAWGLVEFRDAYAAAGELSSMLDCIKWATDYFLKCHTARYEFYGQVRATTLGLGV